MTTYNVIGAGLAGSLVTRLLRKHGFQVRLYDDADPFSGSRASSNLYCAHWLSKFGSESRRGIDVLEHLFPDQIDQPFSRGIADAAKIRHIAQRYLLVEPDVAGRVELGRTMGTPYDSWEYVTTHGGGRNYEGPIVLCCGHRANQLFPGAHPDLSILVGHCLKVKGVLPPSTSSITLPLPYRHAKLYQFDPETIYFADSTRLALKSFEKRKVDLERELRDKCRDALDAVDLGNDIGMEDVEYLVGYRPCTKSSFGELRRLAPQVWSINGGGKQGMVAYAKLAADLLEELKK